jgi:hypothetical protein
MLPMAVLDSFHFFVFAAGLMLFALWAWIVRRMKP